MRPQTIALVRLLALQDTLHCGEDWVSRCWTSTRTPDGSPTPKVPWVQPSGSAMYLNPATTLFAPSLPLSPHQARPLHRHSPLRSPYNSPPARPCGQFLQNDAHHEQMDDLVQDEELRQLLGSPALSTSAMTDEERDEANLALGIALSKRSHGEVASALATLSSSLVSSSSMPATSSSMPMSSSSALGCASLSATSTLASSRSTTLTLLQLKPVYPPGTTPAATQSTRHPRMTTQMSATWMREYRDNTAADAAAIRLMQYKTAVDLRQGRKLTLVFWGLSTARAIVLCIDLHASPQWPHWALVDSPQLLVRLGLESKIVEQYDERMKLWVEVEIDFRHKLTVDSRLFLRIPGALCPDFDAVYSSVTAQPTHIRNNLPRDRRSVRTKANVPELDKLIEISSSDEEGPKKKRKLLHKLSAVKESDEEVEVVGDTMVDDDQEFPASVPFPSPKQRPVLSISIPTTASSSVSTSSSSTPSLTSSVLSTPSSTFSTPSPVTSATSETSSIPAPVLDLSENFPTGFYVNEVVAGFRSMRSAALKTLPIAERFQHIFRRPYKKQTYSDALLHWDLASEAEHQQGLNAGRSPLGLWTNWARGIPLKGANARKRL
ncbi:hypothetical protein MVEN_00102900 [Mycena venus]|uniref:Uncharacterized protein n=1 Tax=Mycena venus TaxID=2733690 RepID=A0A8H7DGM5_9AGAR|nr:hypothetical protein MVEN_00102900 [Mycena venus]